MADNIPPISMVEINFDDESLKYVKKIIKDKINFQSEKYNDNFLKRRLSVRIKANNLLSCKEYIPFLHDNNELEELKKNLTIHVTEFFRDSSFWKFCSSDFFLDTLKNIKNRKIRIWSAGCSSGQEAISILITFLEIDEKLKDRIHIIGTDISNEILSKAKEARYDSYGMKGLTDEIIDKYFSREGEEVIFKEEYRSNFDFFRHDILDDKHLENIDILFFRNTVIYFSKEAKEKLYHNIYDSLNKDSFLILGKTETISGPARDLFKIYNGIERIYVRE